MDARRWVWALLAALLAAGCGTPQTERLGSGEAKGAYRASIETSRETGDAASQRVREDDRLLNGG